MQEKVVYSLVDRSVKEKQQKESFLSARTIVTWTENEKNMED